MMGSMMSDAWQVKCVITMITPHSSDYLANKATQKSSQHHQHDRALQPRGPMDLPAVLFVCGSAGLQLADVGRRHAFDAAQPPRFGAEVVLTYFTGANDAIGHDVMQLPIDQ